MLEPSNFASEHSMHGNQAPSLEINRLAIQGIAIPVLLSSGIFLLIGSLLLYLLANGFQLPFKNFAVVLGVISVVSGSGLLLVGTFLVIDAWFDGSKVIFTNNDLQLHYLFGFSRSEKWSHGINIEFADRLDAVRKEGPLLIVGLLFGPVGKLIEAALAEFEIQNVTSIEIHSEVFHVKFDPEPTKVPGLRRWLCCRELADEITNLGGFVTWDEDGFTSLTLAGTSIDDENFSRWLKVLRSIPQLAHIDVRHTQLSNSVVADLAELSGLKLLELAGSGITEDQLPTIFEKA